MAAMLTVNRTAKPSDSKGFQRMFAPDRLTLGVFFPIEAFSGDQPTMLGQERLARRAEELGYAALWCRGVPHRDPSFGDVGQVYDPWVYLGWIAAGGRHFVLRFLEGLRAIGVNHVILNFKYGARSAGEVLEEIGQEILPQLAASQP